MKINNAEGWNRKKRTCEHCSDPILKDEAMQLLFTEKILLPVTLRGIAFHEGCLKEELEELLTKI